MSAPESIGVRIANSSVADALVLTVLGASAQQKSLHQARKTAMGTQSRREGTELPGRSCPCKSYLNFKVAFLAVVIASGIPGANHALAQTAVVNGVFASNSGAVQLNPSSVANYTNTSQSLVLINPCTSASGYAGTSCAWPISSKQWPEPQLSFTVAAPYNTTSYSVDWQMDINYVDGNGVDNTMSLGSSGLAGNQTFTPSVSASDSFGGGAVVQAYITSVHCRTVETGLLKFYIWGVNQSNSTQLKPVVAQYSDSVLGENAWFLPQLIGQESDGGLQFKAKNGQPLWGPPDGNGVMQVDREANTSDYESGEVIYEGPYWDFEVNVDDGMGILNSKRTNAYSFWDRQVKQECKSIGGSKNDLRYGGLGTEYCNVALKTFPSYPGSPSLGATCGTAMAWSETTPYQHWQDFNWLQSYNGAPCGYFLSWSTSSKAWVFKTGSCTTKSGTVFPNYIVKVCGHAAAY